MTTMQVFHMTAPASGMITLPVELRGKPLKIVVEQEEKSAKKMTNEEYYEFLMKFPVATDEEIEEYNEFRRHFRCRAE